ncbi:MAG: hypothetical protein MUO58_22115 [Anaerolineales bacterium]|nr:hypothetical protein [Anaerolineales bacterium]
MSPELIRILITAAILLHGVAHAKAFFALIANAATSGDRAPVPVRSWLFPSLSPRAVALLASPFWLLSTTGFVAASLSFWGILAVAEMWRQLAIGSSVISALGIALFSGIWPGAPSRKFSALDTAIALFMDAAILVLLLWAKWPPESMFGK